MTAVTQTEIAARAKLNGFDGSQETAIINVVFAAMWSASLPVDRIAAIASAICNATVSVETAQRAATKGVKAGILRTHVIARVRYYELTL